MISLYVLSCVSPLSHCLLALCKRVVIIVSSSIVFGIQLERSHMIGLALFSLGTLYYYESAKLERVALRHRSALLALGLGLLLVLGLETSENRHIGHMGSVEQSPKPVKVVWMYEAPPTREVLGTLYQLSAMLVPLIVVCGYPSCEQIAIVDSNFRIVFRQ